MMQLVNQLDLSIRHAVSLGQVEMFYTGPHTTQFVNGIIYRSLPYTDLARALLYSLSP